MYRLADYVCLPLLVSVIFSVDPCTQVGSLWLKSLAKDGIWQRLSKPNIITELFSTFT